MNESGNRRGPRPLAGPAGAAPAWPCRAAAGAHQDSGAASFVRNQTAPPEEGHCVAPAAPIHLRARPSPPPPTRPSASGLWPQHSGLWPLAAAARRRSHIFGDDRAPKIKAAELRGQVFVFRLESEH